MNLSVKLAQTELNLTERGHTGSESVDVMQLCRERAKTGELAKDLLNRVRGANREYLTREETLACRRLFDHMDELTRRIVAQCASEKKRVAELTAAMKA